MGKSKSQTSISLPPLGAHCSIAGGVDRAVERAVSLEATALQLFLKNNNQWRGRPIAPDEAERFRRAIIEGGFAPPIAHSSYLINLASPGGPTASLSIEAMVDELERAAQLAVAGVVVHPGAHMGEGEAAGLRRIIESINQIFARTVIDSLVAQPPSAGIQQPPPAIYLETTAGMGSSLGWRFEHLAEIIAGVEDQSRIGVCLDTCHVFAAGYDIRTPAGVKAMLKELDRTVGLARLRAIHVNDSKKALGSRCDRHEHIGQGEIGEACFQALLCDRRLRQIPFILETPKSPDLAEDRMNLATLRRLAGSKIPEQTP